MFYPNLDGTNTASPTGNTCDPHNLNCGDGFLWNPVLNVCQPTKPECPSGQKPNSLGKCAPEPCPDGMVQQQDGTCKPKENECPQGEVKGPDGSCVKKPDVCGAGKAMGSDGTCKDDKDGDGKPDDEEGDDKDKDKDGKDDPSFSGGDSCDAPPACSGDAILCGQASIQWRIDCNTRHNVNIAGGACGTPPVCTGDKCDAIQYASLLMQWRTACALEKGTSSSGGFGQSDSDNLSAIKGALTGNAGNPDIGDPGDPSGAFTDGSNSTTGDGKLDTSGFGYGRSCPTIPDVSVFGQALHFDTSPFCSFIVLGGQLVLVFAALASLRIISSGGDS